MAVVVEMGVLGLAQTTSNVLLVLHEILLLREPTVTQIRTILS
jgi:hypothetical protein